MIVDLKNNKILRTLWRSPRPTLLDIVEAYTALINRRRTLFDKHSFNTIVDGTKNQNDDEFQCVLAPIHYFEKLEVECSHYFKGVTG